MMLIMFKPTVAISKALETLETVESTNEDFQILQFEDGNIGTAFAELLELLDVTFTVVEE